MIESFKSAAGCDSDQHRSKVAVVLSSVVAPVVSESAACGLRARCCWSGWWCPSARGASVSESAGFLLSRKFHSDPAILLGRLNDLRMQHLCVNDYVNHTSMIKVMILRIC
jgi:hypothetical protein